MREALAREGDHLRLLLTPTRQRISPLTGATWLERLFAARNHAAVDDAAQHRRHLSRGDRDHGLVEQP